MSRYAEHDRIIADQFGLDPALVTAAITAAWSNLNPQSVARVKAQSVALAVLLEVKRVYETAEDGSLVPKRPACLLEIPTPLDEPR